MARFVALLVLVLTAAALPARAETYLLMAEEDGCVWCARWDREIAHIYPKTAEGAAAPLRRYNLHRDTPEVELATRVRFTPTFILVRDGVEIDRIEGYPGEDFFWGLLEMMMERASMSAKQAG